MPHTQRDPVCGTQLAATESLSQPYRNTTFHFCSEACRARFNQYPGLFAGAHRLSDIPVLRKRHCLRLTHKVADDLPHNLAQQLGILSAEGRGHRLLLEYDLRLVSLEQIEACILAHQATLRGGLHALRRALWKFTEGNELAQAAQPGTGACCNRPPTRLH